jgi:rhamnosyl/mannosyltransferase
LQLGKFYPPVRGGIETTTRQLVEGLVARNVPTDVLVAHTRPHTERVRDAAGHEIVRVASFGQWLSVSVAPRLPLELRAMAERYDIIHVHMPDPLAALALWRVRPRARVVLHWHSDVVRQRQALRLYAPLQRWLLERADAVIATSKPYLEASVALAPWRDKVRVLPLGIADPMLAVDQSRVQALRAEHGGRRLVSALGRMTYYKGFEHLIDAAALLPDDVRVLIAGAGPGLAACRDRVRARGLQDRLVLLGDIDDAEVPALMAASELFCLPSTERAEAFGLAMLEAMALARPVVCTRIEGSGVPWLNRHGETGLVVPPSDVGALAAALNRLLADKALATRLGAGARARYEGGFKAEHMVHATLDLYRQLLATPADCAAIGSA